MFAADKKEKMDIMEIRLSDLEERLKNLEIGHYALEEHATFPGTLFQLEKALQEACTPLQWPVENELNVENFKRNFMFICEAIGRSILALHKRLEEMENIAAKSNQLTVHTGIISKISKELKTILHETIPTLTSSLNGSLNFTNEANHHVLNTINRLSLRLSLLDNALECSLIDYRIYAQIKTSHRIRLKEIPGDQEFDIFVVAGDCKNLDLNRISSLPQMLSSLANVKKGDTFEFPSVAGITRYEVIEVYP